MARLLLFVLVSCSLGILGLAGVAKLISLELFWWDLIREHGMTREWAAAIAVVVPVCELAIAGSWAIGTRRRTTAAAGIVLLSVFTVYLLYHYFVREAPSCSCAGILAQYASWLEKTEYGIIRNLVMLVPLGVYLGVGARNAALTVEDGQ